MSQSFGTSLQQAAFNGPTPQPTDMQTHVQRANEVAARLNGTCEGLIALIGRLYGEGQIAKEGHPTPRPAGLCAELTSALSDIEDAAARLAAQASRLEQLA